MTTYYVDPVGGSNSNNGLSVGAAFLTTARSETVVAAGDTVKLLNTGTEALTGANTITLSVSGTATARVYWIGCDSSGNELADGSYYTISGSGMNASTDIVATAATINREIRHVKFDSAKRFALMCTSDPSNFFTVVSCSIVTPTTACFGAVTNGAGYQFAAINCVLTGSGSGGSQRVGYNTGGTGARNDVALYGCLVSSFYQVHTDGQVIFDRNCIFVSNGNVGGVVGDQNNNAFSDCVFYGNTVCCSIGNRTGQSTGIFYNCLFHTNTTVLSLNNGTTNTALFVDYCCFYANTNDISTSGILLKGIHCISGSDPKCNAVGSNDFSLKSGSPLIGKGPNGGNLAGLTQVGGGSGGGPLIGEGPVY